MKLETRGLRLRHALLVWGPINRTDSVLCGQLKGSIVKTAEGGSQFEQALGRTASGLIDRGKKCGDGAGIELCAAARS